ncbi:YceI family protein [Ohtaekwangia koreensis]|uniref:Polyisoprenoid-binding protein YceI n=1 Tax=Ohtaekwangia koreensis TaxID=688867 RepID=A0A1T5M6A2_9BACT|nr:YceI family protein [Ohtaekwangia koreensis]SKC83409.1 Polyisoprenoid-binding protein YceI [Ohtaekwangia koreensis]
MKKSSLLEISVSDSRNSSIGFTLDRNMGEALTGTFVDFDATMLLLEADLSTAVLKMAIYTDSVKAKDVWLERRFKGSTCFRVNEYRTITFQSTDWEKISNNEYLLYGKFCLCGIYKYVVFEITDHGTTMDADGKTKLLKLEFKGNIKRFDFNIARGISSWDISEDIELHGIMAFKTEVSTADARHSRIEADHLFHEGYL